MAKAIDQVKALYEKVQAKKAAIVNAEKSHFLTDGFFKFSQVGNTTDLKVVRNVSALVDIVAFLYARSDAHKRATEFLNVVTEDNWLSAPISAWLEDCKTRSIQLNIAAERTKLRSLEESLLRLSPKLAQQVELDEIVKALA